MKLIETWKDTVLETRRQVLLLRNAWKLAMRNLDEQTGKAKPVTLRVIVRQHAFSLLVRGKIVEHTVIDSTGREVRLQVVIEDVGFNEMREELRLAHYAHRHAHNSEKGRT